MAVKRVGEQYHAKMRRDNSISESLLPFSELSNFLKVELLLSYGKTDFRLQDF